MRTISSALLVLLTLLAPLALAGAQTVYKSIGANGAPVYSDHPPKDGKISKIIVFADLPGSSISSSPIAQSSASPRSADPPASAAYGTSVVLYTTSWCGYCKGAKAYLSKRKIAFREVDIETPYGRSVFAQAGGKSGVPLLVASGKRLSGFSATGYDAFFGKR